MNYFKNIFLAVSTITVGLTLSIQHFFSSRKKRNKQAIHQENYFEKEKGTFTVQYPHEKIPVPDHGRYKLHNEIGDCIVCDKCAKICPVNCIDIEPIRAKERYGKTSDGTPLRIYAAKFDIDMAKCFFCGLCTVVCPTECLTMTKEFDFSTDTISDHHVSFSKMSEEEIAIKKREFEEFQKEKTQKVTLKKEINSNIPVKNIKPIFRPKIHPKK